MSSISANREFWNRISAKYQRAHDPQIGAGPRLWGNFSLPDDDLGALGDVTARRVLELGCGAGQWSRVLAGEGAQSVGFDLSDAQLRAAKTAMQAARYPLVQGAAQRLPFASASFDLVFCDHGGLSWAPPQEVVPEAARVLRPSGRLVFNVSSPWLLACYDDESDRLTPQLHHDYFGQSTVPEGDGASTYPLSYGSWIRTLRAAGLIVDDLIEPRPGRGTHSSYLECEPPDWATRWPCEALWVTHKPPGPDP